MRNRSGKENIRRKWGVLNHREKGKSGGGNSFKGEKKKEEPSATSTRKEPKTCEKKTYSTELPSKGRNRF